MSAYQREIVRTNDRTGNRSNPTMDSNGRFANLVDDLVFWPTEGHSVNPIIEDHPTMSANGWATVVHRGHARCACPEISPGLAEQKYIPGQMRVIAERWRYA